MLVFASTSGFAASGLENFNEGLQAYRSGDYEKAITLFEAARKKGIRKVAVYFNLGSSYYRLGEYDKAIPMFEQVTKFEKMADVGHFNLGLVARQQEKNELARIHFNQAIASSRNKKLIYLAQQNLEEIDARTGVWSGSAVAETGYDDNVSNTALGPASGGDSYLTLRAGVQAMLSGTRKKGWSAYGSFYHRSYSTVNTYNLGSMTVGARRHMPVFGQQGYVGGYYKALTLGGSGYENISGLEMGAESRVRSGVQYRYRYRIDSIATAATYNYLQGTRQRLRLERHSRPGKNSSLRLVYRLEKNDRQNSPVASYTNVRHGLRAIYTHRSDAKTRWRYTARYRLSDYTPVAAQNRDDSMTQLSVERSAMIRNNLEWTAKYSITRNDSTDSAYTYTSNVYQLGIRKKF